MEKVRILGLFRYAGLSQSGVEVGNSAVVSNGRKTNHAVNIKAGRRRDAQGVQDMVPPGKRADGQEYRPNMRQATTTGTVSNCTSRTGGFNGERHCYYRTVFSAG